MKKMTMRVPVLILALSLTFLAGCGEKVPAQPDDKVRPYYELLVGSFYDSDGDGTGDLNGVTRKLDYLNDGKPNSTASLHVGGLWMLPIFPSPTYHKYDATDYYSVDPAYGTMEDFDALLRQCGRKHIDVILDLALNHTSSEHPWFQKACKSRAAGAGDYLDWYCFSEEKLPGYSPVPGAHGWYYEAQFWSGMPDLNLDSEEVRAEILKICRFWLDKGVAGFRLDAVTSYYSGNTTKNTEFLRWLKTSLTGDYPDVYLVGEAWSDEGTIGTLYTSGVDTLFAFPLAQSAGTLISDVRSGDGAHLAGKLAAWQRTILEKNPGAIDGPFLTNHDMARSAGALMGKLTLQKQAAAVYLLLPGNPYLYYGEELGMTGGGAKDEDKRMPMVWSSAEKTGIPNPPPNATGAEPLAAGVKEQLKDKDSLLRFYVDALKVRARHPALARGVLTAAETGEDAVCGYTVSNGGETLEVYHNLGDAPVTVPAHGALTDTLSAGGEKPALSEGALHLPPYSTAILQVSP